MSAAGTRAAAAEAELVAWYLDLYRARTGSGDVLDALPGHRVPWSEVLERGRALGALPILVVDARLAWHRIRTGHKVAARERRIEREYHAANAAPTAAEILGLDS